MLYDVCGLLYKRFNVVDSFLKHKQQYGSFPKCDKDD